MTLLLYGFHGGSYSISDLGTNPLLAVPKYETLLGSSKSARK
jgi:hypothetical protein